MSMASTSRLPTAHILVRTKFHEMIWNAHCYSITYCVEAYGRTKTLYCSRPSGETVQFALEGHNYCMQMIPKVGMARRRMKREGENEIPFSGSSIAVLSKTRGQLYGTQSGLSPVRLFDLCKLVTLLSPRSVSTLRSYSTALRKILVSASGFPMETDSCINHETGLAWLLPSSWSRSSKWYSKKVRSGETECIKLLEHWNCRLCTISVCIQFEASTGYASTKEFFRGFHTVLFFEFAVTYTSSHDARYKCTETLERPTLLLVLSPPFPPVHVHGTYADSGEWKQRFLRAYLRGHGTRWPASGAHVPWAAHFPRSAGQEVPIPLGRERSASACPCLMGRARRSGWAMLDEEITGEDAGA
ncbi:hypothetical protein DFH11DRAFT_1547807 [Phellopilus nigrolimitatus]|nr:hypothetical protein DFH11DRAFT_1547807 [Phellopilus nigrolimitatus]